MGIEENIWFAVRSTRVILAPRQRLETFGSTVLRYHFLSELMDEVNRVRVREGTVYSERPKIITPSHFADVLLDGFGEKAKEYAGVLKEQGDLMAILQYGLQFRKSGETETLVSNSIEAVADKVKGEVESSQNPLSAVVIGADELWEVSLIRFLTEYIQRSAPGNISDLQRSGAFPDPARDRAQRMQEIEEAFQAAAQDRSRMDELGSKLQRYGLFERYQDRFFALIRRYS